MTSNLKSTNRNEDLELYALVAIADALLYLCSKLQKYDSSLNCGKLYRDFIGGKISVREAINAMSTGDFVFIRDLFF